MGDERREENENFKYRYFLSITLIMSYFDIWLNFDDVCITTADILESPLCFLFWGSTHAMKHKILNGTIYFKEELVPSHIYRFYEHQPFRKEGARATHIMS